MTISIFRYVSINSAVLGAPVVGTRQLILNIFTVNPLLPPQTYITFTTPAEVGTYFGTSSEEYYRASTNYFNWISKNNTSPYLIQFTRWVKAAVAPFVVGYLADTAIADWSGISNGYVGVTIGSSTTMIGPINFSSVTTLANVASDIQTAINAYSAGGADFTAATVTYANGAFTLTGGVVGSDVIAIQPGVGGTDISGFVKNTGVGQLGWLPQSTIVNGNYIPGATWSQGSLAETIPQTLGNAASANNNFGSIAFCYTGIPVPVVLTGTITSEPTLLVTALSSTASLAVGMTVSGTGITVGTTIAAITSSTAITLSQNATINGTPTLTFTDVNTGLTLAQYVSAANWNYSLVPNNLFKLMVPVNSSNATTWQAALGGIGGVCISLTDYSAPVTTTTQYPEQCDAVIMAATNYNPGAINSVQNYMFQQFPLLRSLVSSDSVANAYDAIHINYIGLTQNAGQQISFYQRGFLQGGVSDAKDSGVYANEQWFKSAITTQIMNLLLTQNYVPANTQGIAQLNAIMQAPIQQALLNGTISVGKTLTALQISNIGQVTGNPLAWQQVQNSGFYLVITITPSTLHAGEYQANYTLVYSKNDVIRFVQGTDDLI